MRTATCGANPCRRRSKVFQSVPKRSQTVPIRSTKVSQNRSKVFQSVPKRSAGAGQAGGKVLQSVPTQSKVFPSVRNRSAKCVPAVRRAARAAAASPQPSAPGRPGTLARAFPLAAARTAGRGARWPLMAHGWKAARRRRGTRSGRGGWRLTACEPLLSWKGPGGLGPARWAIAAHNAASPRAAPPPARTLLHSQRPAAPAQRAARPAARPESCKPPPCAPRQASQTRHARAEGLSRRGGRAVARCGKPGSKTCGVTALDACCAPQRAPGTAARRRSAKDKPAGTQTGRRQQARGSARSQPVAAPLAAVPRRPGSARVRGQDRG